MSYKQKESILDLEKYLNKEVCVKFVGGREVKGVLRSFDSLVNLVLDDAVEFMRDTNSGELTRFLGQTLCRNVGLMSINPIEGFEQLKNNPFESSEINKD